MITKFVHGEWHTDHDDDPVQIGDSAGQFVAMTLPCGDSIGTARDYENAAFIVRACNAHAELVAALEQTYQALSMPGTKGNLSHAETLTMIRAALAKANKAKGEA